MLVSAGGRADLRCERALHDETALRLKLALHTMRGVVVTNVPYHLGPEDAPQSEVELRQRWQRQQPVLADDEDTFEPE